MKKYIYQFLALIIFSSCSKPNPCKTNKSDFNDLYNNILTSNNNTIEDDMMDTEIHAYTFSVTTPQEICAIGYKSWPAISNQKYNIVIIDSLNNNTLLSVNETFSPTTTSYISLTNPIELAPGNFYTINRIQTNWNPFITNTIGRMLFSQQMDSLNFPYTNGVISIHKSAFYSMGGPLYNIGIPYIDIVFKD